MTQDSSPPAPRRITTSDSTNDLVDANTSINADRVNTIEPVASTTFDDVDVYVNNADIDNTDVAKAMADPEAEIPNDDSDNAELIAEEDADAIADTGLVNTNSDKEVAKEAKTEDKEVREGDGEGIAVMPEPEIIITQESPDVVVAEIANESTPEILVEEDGEVVGHIDEQSEFESVAELAEAELAANALEEEEQKQQCSDNPTSPTLETSEDKVLELAGISAGSMLTKGSTDTDSNPDTAEAGESSALTTNAATEDDLKENSPQEDEPAKKLPVKSNPLLLGTSPPS